MFLVRVRTIVKNRIQALLARHHVPLPAVSDIFGKRGLDYPEARRRRAGTLAPGPRGAQDFTEEVRASEKWLHQATRSDQRIELLRTIPGFGELLATVVALEIDRVERFANPAERWPCW